MARSAPFPALLPLYTLDLLRRYWAPLLCVWLIGDFVHRMLMRGMAQLVTYEEVLAYVALGVVLMVQLATYIIMFHKLRPGLPLVDAEYRRTRTVDGRRTLGEAERNLVDAVAMAILPFLLFYSAWDLLAEEYRRFLVATVNQEGLGLLLDVGSVDKTGPLLAVALAAFGLRALFEWVYNRGGNKAAGALTAVFESTWMFLGVFTVMQVVAEGWKWVNTRAASVAVLDTVNQGLHWLNALVSPFPLEAAVLAALRTAEALWDLLKGGFIEPLLWLTITAVIFGAQMDRYSGLFRKGSRLDRAEQAVTGKKGPFRATAVWVRRDVADKYIPFINAFRFILSVSPVFYLSFSLYYVVLELGFDWLERGVYHLMGPADWMVWWWQWLEPMEVLIGALRYTLRICLLAATFELILRKIGEGSTGRRARASAMD